MLMNNYMTALMSMSRKSPAFTRQALLAAPQHRSLVPQ